MKLFITDLDKTLLNDEGSISEENLTSLNDLSKNKISVAFASGRSYESINKICLNNKITPYIIALNGAQIFNSNGTLISKNPLKYGQVKNIIDFCNKNNIIYQIYTDNNVYTKLSDNLIYELVALGKTKSNDIETILKGCQIYFDLFYRNNLLTSNIEGKIICGHTEIYKIEITSGHSDLLDEIKNIGDDSITISSSSNVNIEITNCEINKGIAIKELCNHLNIPLKETVAIGDNKNDIEMLKTVEIGISMGNAVDELKRISRYISNKYDENGVAHAIKNYIL